jgi:hypothetical protein
MCCVYLPIHSSFLILWACQDKSFTIKLVIQQNLRPKLIAEEG